MAIAALASVTHRFASGTVALADLSLAIAPGEFLTLLGPSGCGKSTALRLIAGLVTPSAGRVTRDLPAPAPGTHPVGFVFQEPTLMPWASVRENVDLPLRLKRSSGPAARAAVAAALAAVGLAGFERAYPRELSGGMRMRVSLARALVARPAILLLDEPFAALDEMTRQKLNDDLLALWRGNGLTIAFVTHSVYEAVYLSTRIVVMTGRPGRVAAIVENDEPYPRDESYRTSARYGARCAAVSAALRAQAVAAMSAARPPEGANPPVGGGRAAVSRDQGGQS